MPPVDSLSVADTLLGVDRELPEVDKPPVMDRELAADKPLAALALLSAHSDQLPALHPSPLNDRQHTLRRRQQPF